MDGGRSDRPMVLAGGRPADVGRGIVRIARTEMLAMGLGSGDLIEIAGARVTHARLLPGRPGAEPGQIEADAGIRANIEARVGETVILRPAALSRAVRVKLLPDHPQRRQAQAGIAEVFRDALLDIAVTEGDAVRPASAPGARVVAVDPGPAAIVGPDTRIEIAEPEAADKRYPGVGGLREQIARLREMIDLPLERPDLFEALGIVPPRGVLFTGPPGSGKTLLARAVADQGGAAFFQIAGPEIVSKHYGDSERALREVFEAATRSAPAIIFIDELDAIAPRRDSLSGEKQLERRVVAQLLTLLDGLDDRGRVVVMAATNLPSAIDPALRRPGRLDRELRFEPPDEAGRREILEVHLASARLAGDVDLDALAAGTSGYVGADLAALAGEAGIAALHRLGETCGGWSGIDGRNAQITAADLSLARTRVRPSVLRDAHADTREVRWSDIGGLDAAKAALTEAVIWPLTHPGMFERLGLSPARGVLLAGPPGGGKTLLAQALACESGVAFIPVRAAHLLSQFLGEAERAVAEVFATARQAAPAILFMDELDAIAPRRGSADAALDRVVAQLLTEIDGLADNRGLFLLGATNRAAAIDPALLRPGRFDLVLEVPPPDSASRAEILAVHTRSMPLDPSVDLGALAEATEGMTGAALAALVQAAARPPCAARCEQARQQHPRSACDPTISTRRDGISSRAAPRRRGRLCDASPPHRTHPARSQVMSDLFDLQAVASAADADALAAALGPGARIVAPRELPLCAALGSVPASSRWQGLRGGPGAGRRALARQLLDRQRRLEAMHAVADILPAASGAPLSEDVVALALRLAESALVAALERTRGLEQVQISVEWPPERVLQRFCDSPEIAALRSGAPVGAAAIFGAVGALRLRLAARYRALLDVVAADTLPLPCAPPDAMILNLACAVPRGRDDALQPALEAIDADWPDGLRIRAIGPGPLVSFSALHLSLVPVAEAACARGLLGLPRDAGPEAVEPARKAAQRRHHPDHGGGAGPSPAQIDRAARLALAATRAAGAGIAAIPLIDIRAQDSAEPDNPVPVQPARAAS